MQGIRVSCFLSAISLPSLLWCQAYVIKTVAGSDSTFDGLAATSTSLFQVEGVAIDATGNIYVSDAGDNRVRRISTDGIIQTLAGNGLPGFRGDGGPAANAQLRNPYGVAVDRDGSVYIADLGNARIRKITPDGKIATVAGGGTIKLTQVSVVNPATEVALMAPRNLTIDANNVLYFSDFVANFVCRVSPDGTIRVVAGTGGSERTLDGSSLSSSAVSAPAGLAIDSAGSLFIAESRYGRVRKVSQGIINTVYPFSGSTFSLATPTGLALDKSGALYISDGLSGQILKLFPNGTVIPISMTARDVALDNDGNLYTALGQFVWRLSTSGILTPIAGDGKFGYSGDRDAAGLARMLHPAGLAYDSQGNLYIADEGNHRIRMVSPIGRITTIAGFGDGGLASDGVAAVLAKLNSPGSVAVDANGLIYIADTGNHRIRRITSDGVITTFAGTGNRGFLGDGTSARFAWFDSPGAVLPDRSGNIYISDTNNNRIRRISPDGYIVTVAGSLPAPGYAGDNSPGVFAQLNKPTAIALDRNGNLLIADTGNNRIRRLDRYGTITSLPITDLRGPRGLAVEADDSILISDTGNHRICKWKPDGTLITVAGTGRADFDGDNGPALLASLNYPAGLAIGPDGMPVIADYSNNRVRKLIPAFAPAALEAGPVRAVVNAASFLEGPVAPGEAISILGGPFGPPQPVRGNATVLGGVQVRFDGVEAALTFASDKQINATVPASVAGSKSATMEIYAEGVLISPGSIPVADAAIGIFTNPAVAGQAFAWNSDNSLNTPDNPARRGEVLAIFVTGEGSGPVSVFYAGIESEVISNVAGQINFRIPSAFIRTGTLEIVVHAGSSESQPGVNISVR